MKEFKKLIDPDSEYESMKYRIMAEQYNLYAISERIHTQIKHARSLKDKKNVELDKEHSVEGAFSDG